MAKKVTVSTQAPGKAATKGRTRTRAAYREKATIHIGKKIIERLKETGMTKSEFARRINTTPQNVYGLFKRASCDTELLRQISIVLGYDFFILYNNPKLSKETMDDKARIADLEKRNEVLESENFYLNELTGLQKDKLKKKEK